MGFANCHPMLALLYFVLVLVVELAVSHPIYLALTLMCAALYSVRLNGRRGLALCLALIPVVILFAAWYAGYHHFGVTQLGFNFIGNPITLESFCYGLLLGARWAGVLLWLSCIHRILTADKLVYLLCRLSPKLGILLTLLLRLTPRIKAQARRISLARQGIGKGTGQGGLLPRLRAVVRLCSQLVTWFSEALITASDSMACRGAALRGRTAYARYRFDGRDRGLVLLWTGWLTVTGMGLLLGQGSASFSPALRMNPVTGASLLLYGGYALGGLLPLLVDGFTALRFQAERRRRFAREN